MSDATAASAVLLRDTRLNLCVRPDLKLGGKEW